MAASSSQRGKDEIMVGSTAVRVEGSSLNAVFVLHGRLGSREDVRDIVDRVVSGGSTAIYFDLPNHGAREMHREANTTWADGNEFHAMDMYVQMVETVQIISLCIDLLPLKLGRRFASIAVLGVSQGGHTALLAMTNEPRIDICVAFISSGDSLQNFRVRHEKLPKANRATFESLIPEPFQAFIMDYDPIHNIRRLSTRLRPIIMLNGGSDTLVPSVGNQELEARLRPIYERGASGDKLVLKIYPNVKHAVPPEMLNDGIAFLERHQKPFFPISSL